MISLTGAALTAVAVAAVVTRYLGSWTSRAWPGSGDVVRNATITFAAVIVVSLVLDRIAFFEWAAPHILARAKGDAKRALLYVLGLGAPATAFFANDGAAPCPS